MFATVPVPQKGDRISAAWGAAVANGINALTPFAAAHGLVRQGVGNGTEPLPENRRNRTVAAEEHPWKVYALTQSEDVDHCFEIYIPANVLTLGKASPEIEGLSSVGDSGARYKLEDESEIGDGATIFVAVVRTDEEESEGASSEEEEEPGVSAKVIVSSALPVEEDGETFLSIFPVATVIIDDSGDYPVGTVARQYAKSVVALTEPGNEPDGISTDTVTDEDAEDPNALQIKDFDNEESDSEQGLTQRIEVVKDGDGEDASYHLEAKDHEGAVFLLARVNGKIRYIPLTGTVEEEEEEEKPVSDEDPCKHPGSNEGGGVSPDDDAEDGGSGGGSGEGDGVSADGDEHVGKACNSSDCT